MTTVQGEITKVVFESGSVIEGKPASLSVYEDGKLLVELKAVIVSQQGADGGWHPSVKFNDTKDWVLDI